jgi:ABC-type sulfate/molybdate transport systems ATPase subunit
MSLLTVAGIHKQLSPSFSLQDIHFTQQKTQRISITGETGSGKSSLLKIIAGLLQPDTGTVWFNGARVEGPDEQLVPGHPAIAYLSQDHELRNNYRIEELLEYANKLSAEEAADIYRLCRIDHLLQRKNVQLSGGEKQRIAIARLLAGSPQLLLLDEPFSNLDLIHKNILKSVIEDISSKLQITCILTSHDPVDTLSWADEIIVMQKGHIVQKAGPAVVYTQPVSSYVAGLFGNYNLLSPEQSSLLGYHLPAGKQLFLRPEDIRLSGTASAPRGTVTGISFRGAYFELEIEAEGMQLRSISLDPGLTIGQVVYPVIIAGRGCIMP